MTRDVVERMRMFGADVEVVRLALNADQIAKYQPPPNPAKLSDTRADKYIAEHGSYSWELDALEPRVLHGLIEDNILLRLDQELYDGEIAMENVERNMILDIEKSI